MKDAQTLKGEESDQNTAIKKTPLYQAIHAARYQRQQLIKEIQTDTGSKLICYVAGVRAPVDREDVISFVDLLHTVSTGEPIDLLLQTGGGNIDAAEKLVTMMRKKTGSARLRIIVPDYAKSAGTLMVLGADSVVMSDTSELGPIDPQVERSDRNGNLIWHSVTNYLDAYRKHSNALKKDATDVTAQMMLNKLDPETVVLFENVMDRAREVGEDHLKLGMMNAIGNWSQAVSALLDGKQFKTHGQPITWEDALDKSLGLAVEYLEPNNTLWLKYWQLYCLQLLAVQDNQKLFEGEIASLCIDSRAAF